MKITGLDGPDSIRGCVKLYYRDFTISLSTISQPPDLLVFDKDHKEVTGRFLTRDRYQGGRDFAMASAEGIREVMGAIDRHLKEEE
jgi:galactose-1-phosphate uridylyltransferase